MPPCIERSDVIIRDCFVACLSTFCCATAASSLTGGFHEKDGKPYCRSDYLSLFAPKCGGCTKPITDNYITALNAQWHPECFVCRDCKCSFSGTSFYTVDAKPVCPKCLGVDEDDEEEAEEN
ncbi:Transforming growth factor beta-1-induced transcript 1 protein [Orchesella cincta]|uniref:Transforming growth factor beta-1-induced transcript 1 protein n=1 Tax=Orchesella cincta TaxID=48709 RepID=A0A1D2N0Z8_ORCCI|nr:Transforming growth factor beta-1-induced transcript 1 protein [Orchesella cincta]